MTFVVTEACVDVKDKECIAVCPVDCLFEGERMMYINSDQCINCGACEPVCPVSAIRFDEELEGDDEKFIAINDEFFEIAQPPKGGRKLGVLPFDATYVTQLPQK